MKQDVHEQNIRKVENRAVLLSWLWKTNCTSTYKRLLLRRQETTTFEPVLLPGKCVFAISGGRQWYRNTAHNSMPFHTTHCTGRRRVLNYLLTIKSSFPWCMRWGRSRARIVLIIDRPWMLYLCYESGGGDWYPMASREQQPGNGFNGYAAAVALHGRRLLIN